MRCVIPEHLGEMCKARSVDDALSQKKIPRGRPLFMRIFKKERILEVWSRKEDGSYEPLKAFPICKYSGKLGPKKREGDKQAPEGFYTAYYDSLNAKSKYYRSINIGYPNTHDRQNGYTGSAIMIHGKCHSVGCFAMTDAGIHDIFKHAFACLDGCRVCIPIHIFPFRMEKLDRYKKSPWYSFWQTLLPAYTYFEQNRRLPKITTINKRYAISTY